MKVLRMLVDVADHDFDKQRGDRLGIGAAIFDSWLPVKDAAPAWCDVLGLTRAASRAELITIQAATAMAKSNAIAAANNRIISFTHTESLPPLSSLAEGR
jgi:hypothetical protein